MSNSLRLEGGEESKPEIKRSQRLLGLDLFRGIAIFAVVILHSDESLPSQPGGWSTILQFASFAVPFFLAASFYLTVRKLSSDQKPAGWRTRLSRLLIPYGFWSLVYLSQNILRFALKHQSEKLKGLFHDPLGLIFLGKAGFHLYFIPLLVTGILVVMAAEPFIRKRSNVITRIGFVIASLIIYQCYRLFITSISQPSLVETAAGLEDTAAALGAGNPVLSVLLTILGYASRCLPYIAIALLLNHPTIRDRLLKFDIKDTLLIFAAFVILDGIHPPTSLQAVHETLVGYSALLLALALSNQMSASRPISSVGQCSFGIYLLHLLWMEGCWSILKRIGLVADPISILIPLLAATLTFGISWLTTSLLMKQKFLSKIMFGAS